MLRLETRGWAPLYRRIFESDVWLGQNASTKVVLVWIIGSIRHSASETTPAGSVDVTLDEVGRACETSRNTTRASLQALVDANFIRLERTRYGFRITVAEWRRWLACEQESKEPLLSQRRPVTPGQVEMGPEVQNLNFRYPESEHHIITEEVEEGSVASQQMPLTGAVSKIGTTEVVAHFDSAYRAAYSAKPTWGSAQVAQIKRLVKAHGADEVMRRITTMFESPPNWMRPPFTLGTLVKNFDALVVEQQRATSARRGGMSPEEIMQARGRR